MADVNAGKPCAAVVVAARGDADGLIVDRQRRGHVRFGPKADKLKRNWIVRFGPKADIAALFGSLRYACAFRVLPTEQASGGL
jgi:hypothetical protein